MHDSLRGKSGAYHEELFQPQNQHSKKDARQSGPHPACEAPLHRRQHPRLYFHRSCAAWRVHVLWNGMEQVVQAWERNGSRVYG